MIDAAGGQPAARGDRPARIALAHDWLVGYRGGEAVLERIARLVRAEYAPAGLYTMFDDGRTLAPTVDSLPRRVSCLNRIPGGAGRLRRWLLPLYPAAVADLSAALARDHERDEVDLLVSTSSAAVKGMRSPPHVPHLCYCHNPARYVWGLAEEYGGSGPAATARGLGLRAAGPAYRAWDRRTAANVTGFIANSTHTASLIGRFYGRDAAVVHPPVRTGFFTPDPSAARGDFWLVAGALEPYKRVDLAIAAARLAGKQLIVAGAGSQEHVLKRGAGDGASFLGRVSDERLRELFRTAELLLFPGVEDFGIIPVESQACGCPVVARRAGGALDTVVEGQTGAFFDDPTPEAIVETAARAPRGSAQRCRANAERFSEEVFDEAMRGQIQAVLSTAQ
jgi:glycosyltransferase involved in cell wall biosynthesis